MNNSSLMASLKSYICLAAIMLLYLSSLRSILECIFDFCYGIRITNNSNNDLYRMGQKVIKYLP
jgi:hypothetical protein